MEIPILSFVTSGPRDIGAILSSQLPHSHPDSYSSNGDLRRRLSSLSLKLQALPLRLRHGYNLLSRHGLIDTGCEGNRRMMPRLLC
ncbi:hypothetical protein CRG98_027409 [Punica granatum]|uniref:Uncharacterized protein n=1 Tax=Punica granatum TaxID=22663 RepID=A0A2I0J7L2_PUNGR|nr:hypothetical protein CRG98_027409 [Punica granatum]